MIAIVRADNGLLVCAKKYQHADLEKRKRTTYNLQPERWLEMAFCFSFSGPTGIFLFLWPANKFLLHALTFWKQVPTMRLKSDSIFWSNSF